MRRTVRPAFPCGRAAGVRGCGAMLALGAVLLAPGAAPALAQQTGGVAGQVTDNTGGVLPGVTVDVSSPALIGGAQVVFTDSQGRYNAINLPIGVYAVTFTLPGFTTVVRDGIEIGAGFTAAIDASLAVGSVEETITVTGETPVVDVQTVRQQTTLDTRELDVLPTGNIGLQTIANVTPGFTEDRADVGGTRDTWSAQGSYRFYHGKPGTRASFNGFRNQYFIGTASGVGYITNSDTIAEMQVEIAGMGAENGSGSTSLNAVPREGSNSFSASVNGKFSNGAMQGTNLSEELESFGLRPAEVQNVWRAAGTLGGPIARDRLWFYGAIARWGRRVQQPGAFFNALQGQSPLGDGGTLFHANDDRRPADDFDWNRTHALRLTWQATDRNRIGFFGDIQKDCRCTTGFNGRFAIENETGWDMWPAGVVQGSWTAPMTSRLLLEAGVGWQTINWVNFSQPGVVDGVDREIRELSTGFRYGAPGVLIAPKARTGRSLQYFKMSYVTGSHNFRVGVTTEQAFNDESRRSVPADTLNYLFLNQQPFGLLYTAQPFFQQERMNNELGLFVQDAWSVGQFTLTGGLRLDYVTMGFPAAQLDAGPFVPARQVEELRGIPEWTDVNPRAGVSYDLFGDGRTAIKVSIGRFNELTRSQLTREFHPFRSSVFAATRGWNDLDGDYVPDCQLANFDPNGECEGISNRNFGQFIPSATTFSDDVTKANRPYTWDVLAEIQHELLPGVSVSAGYNRNWSGNFRVSDNTLVGPGDYDEYCVTAPDHALLPAGLAGADLCGFYDIRPGLFGVSQRHVTIADDFGEQTRRWQGFTFLMDGRFGNGVRLAGGLDIGEQVVNNCFTVDVPNQPTDLFDVALPGGPFCSHTQSWGNLADFRLHGDIPLPADFSVSWIFKNTPGFAVNADAVFTRDDVRFVDPGRTAPLSVRQVTLPLHAPNQFFTARFTQLDLRVLRAFDLGGIRLDASIDLYNALNSSSIQDVRERVGAAFRQPLSVLDARLLQIYANLRF